MSFGLQRLTSIPSHTDLNLHSMLSTASEQSSPNSAGSFSTKSHFDPRDSGHFGRPPHRSLSYPLKPTKSNVKSCGSWYYLFDRPSSYSHHMLALDKLQYSVPPMTDPKIVVSSIAANDTTDSAVADTSGLNSLDSRSTAFSMLENAIGHQSDDGILRFLIPYSAEGYGFTLAVAEHTVSNGMVPHHSTSTPSASPETENRGQKSPIRPSNICIHAVRKYSPADQVKLPVGAYLAEVGYVTLDPSITLKGAVKLLRQASKIREDKSMPLGVILTHRANRPDLLPIMNGGSKNDDCLSVISSISGASNGPGHPAQPICPPNQDVSQLVNSPLGISLRSLSVSASSSAWSGPVTYPCYASLHRSNPADQNEGSSLPGEATSLRSFGLFPMSSTCAVLCEERCIDPDSTSGLIDGESSLQRRKRLLTLAPPVLHLRWCDVTPQEARRQWAIATLLTELDNVAKELLAGVRAYHLGLRRTANLTKGELDLLFRNIPQVASQAGQLVQRLQGSCLSYSSEPKTQQITTAVCSQTGTRSFQRIPSGDVTKTVQKAAQTRKPNLFTRIRKSIVNNQKVNQNQPLQHGSTEQKFSSNAIKCELQQPSTDHQSTAIDEVTNVPPSHGHLDSPGRIVHGSIDALLNEYAVYTHSHLMRMKQVREFRRNHPELRSLLRAHAMTSVPSFTNFLALPLELLLVLLIRLQKIQEFTNTQHADRPYLDSCIVKLREAVLSPSTTDDPAVTQTPCASRTGTLQSSVEKLSPSDECIRSNLSQGNHSGTQDLQPEPFSARSKTCYQNQGAGLANRELVQLFHSVQSPLYLSPVSESFTELADWISPERHIIFRGPLDCVLSYAQSIADRIADPGAILFTGKVFAYLITDALVLVVSDSDVLISNEDKHLLCEPLLLRLVCNQTYDTELRFTLETIDGLHAQLDCQSVEDKVVWKALIQQRIDILR